MRALFALLVVVVMLFVLGKLPFPAKPQSTPVVRQAAVAKATGAGTAAEAPRPTYVSTRECVRSPFGSINCKEVTTLKP
ncbi:hypothetical protein GJ689_02940 [Rhodoplanes serenus]|jgi:hypothetical protein|uniref:Uncharacterized protein n=1 Tax=Rhodoplanes serenus TaxID=200615 RepID=A0A3S5CY47_9BRAD|nr:hypothetical protein [Rhodoplanes serenus]MTW15159.1 hypothetical protein [Rhodoplanes serenus]VCU07335.1 hypothetical protein RHODGE_RHODGE_00438 [Rhodoplanes serenus]